MTSRDLKAVLRFSTVMAPGFICSLSGIGILSYVGSELNGSDANYDNFLDIFCFTVTSHIYFVQKKDFSVIYTSRP